MVNLYQEWVESGKATFGTTNGKPTRFLQDTSSIPAYFTAILNNWIKADKEGKKNLRCIKEIDGKWRLKPQLAKYSNPLMITDQGEQIPYMEFDTKEEAIENFRKWIDAMSMGERGVRRALSGSYSDYVKAHNNNSKNNPIQIDASWFSTEMQEVA